MPATESAEQTVPCNKYSLGTLKKWIQIESRVILLSERWVEVSVASFQENENGVERHTALKVAGVAHVTENDIPSLQGPIARVNSVYCSQDSFKKVLKMRKTGIDLFSIGLN